MGTCCYKAEATCFLSAPLDSGVAVHQKDTSTVPTDSLLELDDIQGWVKSPLTRGPVAPDKPADTTKSTEAEMWHLFHAQKRAGEEECMEYQRAMNFMHQEMEMMRVMVGQTRAELLRVQDEARLAQLQQAPPVQPPANETQGRGGVPGRAAGGKPAGVPAGVPGQAADGQLAGQPAGVPEQAVDGQRSAGAGQPGPPLIPSSPYSSLKVHKDLK
uniref:Uncharacterized protein n=1 Tax=Sphaerodactylus townsendi TaxID=933632 RepID=A0ACB8EC49_9SAUR